MGFKILSELPEKMYSGMIIQYTLKPLLGIPVRWVTEISQIDEPNYFVDNQLQGPYKIWHHEHHFKIIEGGVEMTDILNYSLPFGVLGRLVHALFVRKKVENIFEYRRKILNQKFNLSSKEY